ncbi:MAG: preprotein translocase subunit SecG [Coriobacteriales bacterium]|nr:preprotein translocase subunit SecG [Coriobacteriales bacterium]
MVMLHSGKGTGVSEMLASTINQTMGTAIVEKNLDRITVILAIIFIVTILVMMIIYPH